MDKKNKTAKYAGAGDLPIVLKTNKAEYFQSKGLLLGFSETGEYEDHEMKLNPGDEIFIVTDGITEARNKEGELYGQDRFLSFIENLDSSKDSIEQMKKEIFDFTGGEVEDDISVISIKVS